MSTKTVSTMRKFKDGGGIRLKIVYPICCGMDVHHDFLVACIATTDEQGVTTYEKRRFSTFSNQLRLCREWSSHSSTNAQEK